MKTFQSESDVRDWVRDNAPHVWWVENKSGGTFGFPDAIVDFGERLDVRLELKLVDQNPGRMTKTIKANPKQLDIIEEMREWGHGAWFLGGLKDSEWLVVLGPEDLEMLRGKHRSPPSANRPKYRIVGHGAWFRGSEYQLLFDYLRDNI